MDANVGWVFSLARSGSSVTAYAAAAGAGGCPVADEVFGPWTRTGPPYCYPPEQPRLKRLFYDSGEHLTPEVVRLATGLFKAIAGTGGSEPARVVCKHPHLMIDPAEFAAAFPRHGAVYLLRNPLHRLNSLHVRRMWGAIEPPHDLARFKEFAARWLEQPHRLLYDDLKRDPAAFFRSIYRAWGWAVGERGVLGAAEYARRHYHHAAARTAPLADPARVRSEHGWAIPREAVEMYLGDPLVLSMMREFGWPTRPEAYGIAT